MLMRRAKREVLAKKNKGMASPGVGAPSGGGNTQGRQS